MSEVWDECDLVVEIGKHKFDAPVTREHLTRWYRAASKAYREIGELKRKLAKLDKQLALPIPCSADEIEIIHLERELEQARIDRVVLSYSIKSPSSFAQRWTVSLLFVSGSWNSPVGLGETKLIALRSALEQVREQRAKQEAAKAAEAEEKAIAEAEARIMAVYERGLIEKPEFPTEPDSGAYKVAASDKSDKYGHILFSGSACNRLEIVIDFANWADALTECTPEWPDVKSMDDTEKVMELIKRGYEIRGTSAGIPCLYKGSKAIMVFTRRPYTLTDVLEWVRRIDGDTIPCQGDKSV